MLLIIGGIVDAVTDTISSVTDAFSNVFDPIASFLSDVTGIDIDAAVLEAILKGVTTGGMSALAEGAAHFGLDSIAEEFSEATGIPVNDVIQTYNDVA